MPRTPSFDREQVIEQALDVFWVEGFQAASMKSLGDAMGLQPGSIYAAFGSKEGLYREVLGRYIARLKSRINAQRLPPKRALEAWLTEHVKQSVAVSGERPGRGCLFMHAAADLGHLDDETASLIRAELSMMEKTIAAAVAASRSGATPDAPTPLATARMLLAVSAGISALSRAGVAKPTLMDMARAALSAV